MGVLQIKLTSVNEDGLAEYLKVFNKENPQFNPSPTQIANKALAEWLACEVAVRKDSKNGKPSRE